MRWYDSVRRHHLQAVPALAMLLSAMAALAPSRTGEAAEFSRELIVGDATIGVRLESDDGSHRIYGALDGLASVTDGVVSLSEDLVSVTVLAPSATQADDGQGALAWEEAAPVLAQVLAAENYPWSVIPVRKMEVIEAGDHSFLVPPALITSARAASAGLLDKLAKRRSVRRKLYARAALRAVTLEEAQRFDQTLAEDLASSRSGAVTLLGVTDAAASSGLNVYRELRTISSMQNAVQHGASTAGIAGKVTQRVSASAVGRSVQALGVLAFAADLAKGFSESRARQRLLAAAAADALLIAGLEDARRLLEAKDADPAMVDGLSDAIEELTSVSQTRLEEYAQAGADALAGSLPALGAAVLTYGGRAGPALVAREVAELGEELVGYTRDVLTVSALATLGRTLRPRIEALVQGDAVGGTTADDYAVREVLAFHDRLGAEATAAIYNMLWTDRWKNASSLADLARGAGLSLAEWLTADAGTEEAFQEEVALRVGRVRTNAEFAAALPEILGKLKELHVGPPAKDGAQLPQMVVSESGEKLEPGRQFRDCAKCPEMVVIPAGAFVMGSPGSEKGRGREEGPAHRVRIPKPFAVGAYEVTFAEWDSCHRAGGCTHDPADNGWGRGDRPVVGVSWRDAQQYVRWLSRKTGNEYRLLSESEWEYAARAGTVTRYWWGDRLGRNRANCEACGSPWDDRETAPVGSFSPNGFGLYDVHGNVREWVEDCWNGGYRGARSDGRPWTGDGDCGKRVLRSGSCINPPRQLRSAMRVWKPIDRRDRDAGFRVAMTLE